MLSPAGYWTVGFGHVIIKSLYAYPDPITEDHASEVLATDVQIAALVSFTFNLGAGALQRSTLRRKVNREGLDEVPAEFLKWGNAGGRKLPGLVRRRQAEADLYEA